VRTGKSGAPDRAAEGDQAGEDTPVADRNPLECRLGLVDKRALPKSLGLGS
jgi:hypothetical protein